MTDKADEPSILLDSPRFDSPTNNMLVANGVPFSIYQGLPFSYRYQLHNEYSGQQYSGRSDRGFISRTFTLPIGGGHFGCRTIDDHDNYSNWSFVWFTVVARPFMAGHTALSSDKYIFFGTRSDDLAPVLEFEVAGQKQIVPVNVSSPDKLLVAVDFEIPAGVHDAVVRYTNVKNSSVTYRFTVPARSAITSPVEDELVTHSQLVFKGTCSPGATITVVEARNHFATLSEARLFNSLTWELALKPGKFLPTGNLAIQTQHLFPGQSHGYSEEVKLNVLGFPVIGSPGPLQETQFNLQGNNGMIGAQVEVFQDLSENLLGSSSLLTSDKWEVALKDLKPGPLSLVAEQSFKGVRSGRGATRDFRIRPPKLEKPEVTVLPNTSLKFSGLGHFDQSLSTEIQFSASNGSLPLPPNTRVDGQGEWETAPVALPLGSHDVRVIQKIADNASGWIESLALDFKVHNDMPDITVASYSKEYRPVFSGEGYSGATVSLRDPDTHEVARSVGVVNGKWSTPALEDWGPTDRRQVLITQHLGDHSSQCPFILYVTILPLAPGLDDLSGEGLEPIFSGTCLPGATVSITFSDDTETYVATVMGTSWTFQRPTPFEANIEHTVEVTQTILDLPSKPASKTFTVHRVMLQPRMVAPVSGSEVGYDLIIEGDHGMQGAVMQLHDSQMGRELGAPLVLLEEGKWSIELCGLELRSYFLHARQTLNGRESTNSAVLELKVVLPPPQFKTPIPGGKAPRTSKIAGTGRPGARVEVWLQGATEPLLTDILVNALGDWEAEVRLPVGITIIWALQTFVLNGIAQRSQPNERLRYKVVPAAAFIETPTAHDHVGGKVVVSGFATPGDTVTVTLGSDKASVEVRENRTWSVTLEPGQVEGNHELKVVAACEGFESDSAKRMVQLATYPPTIEIPAPGRRVSNPVLFAGKGRHGIGVLVDPFNPDKIWVASIQADPDWKGQAEHALSPGGNWCCFRLRPSESDPIGSDWVASQRFEVESAPADKTGLKIR